MGALIFDECMRKNKVDKKAMIRNSIHLPQTLNGKGARKTKTALK